MFKSLSVAALVITVGEASQAQGYGVPQNIGGQSMEQMMIDAVRLRNGGDLQGLLQSYPASEHEALRRSILLQPRTDIDESGWESVINAITDGGPPPIGGFGSSPFEQPVSPDAAGGTYGGGTSEGQTWRESLKAWKKRQVDNDRLTCDAALSLLKGFTCGDQGSCDMEEQYKRKCVKDIDHNDEATYAQCLAVESDYVASCFTGETLQDYLVGHGFSTGRVHDSVILCNAAAFAVAGKLFAATAKHCLNTQSTLITNLHTGLSNDSGPYELHASVTPPFYVAGDFALMEITAVRFSADAALKPAMPRLFAPTVFVALNKFSVLRDEMAQNFNKEEDQGRYYLADQSPLCTVVSYDTVTGAITHTCQSSRGSSGGALIQEIDGHVSLVGVHVGYKDSNINVSNMAQFAPKTAFE